METVNFDKFYQYLLKNVSKGSVMVDDGLFALSIIGVNLNRED